jgi:hypothetical protein
MTPHCISRTTIMDPWYAFKPFYRPTAHRVNKTGSNQTKPNQTKSNYMGKRTMALSPANAHRCTAKVDGAGWKTRGPSLPPPADRANNT